MTQLTFKADEVKWGPHELVPNLFLSGAFSYTPTSALMDQAIAVPMSQINNGQQYRIRVTTNQSKALSVLLRNGSGKAYKGDIYIVSLEQLENLRTNGVVFEVL